jgi:hypothetical protein
VKIEEGGVMDYARLGVAVVFACVAVWYIIYPDSVKALYPQRAFGQNPKLVIRVIGAIFASLAIFLVTEVVRSK